MRLKRQSDSSSGSSDQRQDILVPVVVPALTTAGAEVPPECIQPAIWTRKVWQKRLEPKKKKTETSIYLRWNSGQRKCWIFFSYCSELNYTECPVLSLDWSHWQLLHAQQQMFIFLYFGHICNIFTLSCSASSWESLKINPFSSCFTSSCKLRRREATVNSDTHTHTHVHILQCHRSVWANSLSEYF